MKANFVNSVRELNNVVKNAKAEINELLFSPFAIENTLNAIASGKECKYLKDVIASGYSVENVKLLAKVLKAAHNGKKPFNVDMLAKDTEKRFCNLATSKKCPKHGLYLYNVSEKGFTYYKPIKKTFGAYIAAFAETAKRYVKEMEAEEREKVRAARKEEQKRSRIAEKAAKAKANKELVTKYFGNAVESYTIEEIAKKATLLRRLYGKAA